uniref:Secreted protein n=1 Tax=Plectus sambesii TaxID=2011161 RepID=A0A914XPE1_9BILA
MSSFGSWSVGILLALLIAASLLNEKCNARKLRSVAHTREAAPTTEEPTALPFVEENSNTANTTTAAEESNQPGDVKEKAAAAGFHHHHPHRRFWWWYNFPVRNYIISPRYHPHVVHDRIPHRYPPYWFEDVY